MTAEPTCPGEGPSRNQPGCWTSVGTWTVPSAFVPRVDSETDSPIAGMDKLVGTERTVARVASAGGVLAPGAANLLAVGDGDGAGSAWLPPRTPTLIAAAPASSRNAATNNHDFDTADLLAAGEGAGAGGAGLPTRRRLAVIGGRAMSRSTAAIDNHDFDRLDPTWKSWVMKTRWIPPGWRGDDAEAERWQTRQRTPPGPAHQERSGHQRGHGRHRRSRYGERRRE